MTKKEKIIDYAIGILFEAPFEIPKIINSIKNTDKDFYLVSQKSKQYFVIVTDEFIECRQLVKKITEKKFSIGDFSFIGCGVIGRGKIKLQTC